MEIYWRMEGVVPAKINRDMEKENTEPYNGSRDVFIGDDHVFIYPSEYKITAVSLSKEDLINMLADLEMREYERSNSA